MFSGAGWSNFEQKSSRIGAASYEWFWIRLPIMYLQYIVIEIGEKHHGISVLLIRLKNKNMKTSNHLDENGTKN